MSDGGLKVELSRKDAVRLTVESAHGEFTLRLLADDLNRFSVVCDHCGHWVSFRLTKVITPTRDET